MATPEEEINLLKTEIAVLKEQVEHRRHENKEMKEKHEHYKSISQLLHVATPLLGIIGGFLISWLNKKFGRDHVKEAFTDFKEMVKKDKLCSNCKEETETHEETKN